LKLTLMPSEKRPKYRYRLQFVPSAWTEWQALDGFVKETLRKPLRKRLDKPHVQSGELHGALVGHFKIKLRIHGYRLVYGVQDDFLMVMAVDKCEDSAVYQSAMARISELISELAKVTPKHH
jgi:mRNA interferase RelE/StbE